MPYYIFEDKKVGEVPIGKLVCLARTYKKHAEEMDVSLSLHPVIFLKPASAVIFSGETIQFPQQSKCLHHEVELGLIIGKTGKNISEFKVGFDGL